MRYRPFASDDRHVGFQFIAALALGCAAAAEPITYSARIGQEARLATVDVVVIQGQPSVSLKGVVSAFGGQVRVSANSIHVSMGDNAATLSMGDTEVESSKNRFTIQHPPQVYENDIYIAVSDVIPFFAYAFNLQVQTGTAAQPAPPLSMPSSGRKLIVVLDPGHGGTDSGASGQGPVSEKTIALSIAKRVGELITPSCQAAQTRIKDEGLSSVERVSKVNVGLNGDLLVSIHTGASQSNTASGFQVFCPLGDTDPNVQRSLAMARSISNGLSQTTGVPSRGVRQAPCRIFANLQRPGVLVEVGFMTNPKEEALLANPEYQEKLAQGIANGLIAYIGGKSQ